MNSKEPAAVGNYTSLQRRSKQGKEKKKYYLIYYKNGVLLKGGGCSDHKLTVPKPPLHLKNWVLKKKQLTPIR